MKRPSLIPRYLSIFIAITLICYVLYVNFPAFNSQFSFSIGDGSSRISDLLPNYRVQNGGLKNGLPAEQNSDLIYFNSPPPRSFNRANLKIAFRNDNKNQLIEAGFQDSIAWHYAIKILNAPMLDNLKWNKIGSNTTLYQKTSNYKSLSEFYNKPPINKVIGTFDYSNNSFLQPDTKLPNYTPSNTNTSIDVPLRGKTVMYAYLNHEPFNMTFTKKDLNWYADPDDVKISVYKQKSLVYETLIGDDGNTSGDHKQGQEKSVNIKNPGPGLPEGGVYKIEVDSPNDVLITNITTNLHKIAFEGPLYVAGNHEVYSNVVKSTQPTTLSTNAQRINFKTDHDQSKITTVDKQVINIKKPKEVYTANNNTPLSNVGIPRSDMIVNGSGYFAFTPDQFFTPIPFKVLPINSPEDIEQADYILTNYKTPKREGDWLVAEREFDLNNAMIHKGRLSWIINSPGLNENNGKVKYKQVEMTLSKKGWLKN
jgi:hypothetical protein